MGNSIAALNDGCARFSSLNLLHGIQLLLSFVYRLFVSCGPLHATAVFMEYTMDDDFLDVYSYYMYFLKSDSSLCLSRSSTKLADMGTFATSVGDSLTVTGDCANWNWDFFSSDTGRFSNKACIANSKSLI